MKTGPPSPRHTLTLPLALVVSVAAIPGCSRPLRMKLSHHVPGRPSQTVWWRADDDHGLRAPIVGIEHHSSTNQSQQIVFCDRGVRIFRYRGGRLVGASAPLPGKGGDGDIELVRAALHHYRANPAAVERGAVPVLPPAAIYAVQSVEDVAELLEQHWPGARVQPPFRFTYHQIDTELEYSPHGVAELHRASSAF